ncbi:MAG: TetR/AcrR family transcriptional regulator [Oculatellaceae cyanobacterium Prado106]|jgi:TetR/AcrR family transcriptional repressor of nem operon|nr:TetR/AcrR family transcriptional regulator [Oculatellaceae cyanobacterium Prado106]
MARLREFDTEEVLEAVINAFWERGYEATSLADLMEVTGLQKGSIYKAFGDKRSLFIQALQAYLDRVYSFSRKALTQSDPQQAIADWLQMLADTTPGNNKGCFAVNSLIEMAPHDAEIAKLLEWQFERLGQLLEKAIAKGQKSGVFRRDLSAQALRQLLLITANGTLAASRADFLKSELPAVTQSILAVVQA